jgi:branched-chain amino acid transport system permease protein
LINIAGPATPTTLRRLALGLGIGLALVLPFVLEGYDTYRLTTAGVFAIAVVGLNLLTGQGGQLSVGHVAFYAIGAYITAILTGQGWAVAAALPLAALVAGLAGLGFGYAALRLGAVHLVMVTWGLALAVPQVLKSSHLEAWTGGVQGLYLERPGGVLGLSDDQFWYFVVLVLLGAVIWLAGNLVRGRFGLALRASRDQPLAARAMGINLARTRAQAFAVSGFCAGLAGGLAALLEDFIAPDGFTVFFSILLLVGAVAGGVGSVWGAVFGGLLICYLPELAAGASGALSFPVYGLILLGLIYVMPEGLAGLVERLMQSTHLRK